MPSSQVTSNTARRERGETGPAARSQLSLRIVSTTFPVFCFVST